MIGDWLKAMLPRSAARAESLEREADIASAKLKNTVAGSRHASAELIRATRADRTQAGRVISVAEESLQLLRRG